MNNSNIGRQMMADIFSYRIPSREAFNHRKNFYLCQRNRIETNENWFQRIRNCVSRCDFGGFSEFLMLDKFVSGLNSDIIERCRPAQALSIAQLMSIANNGGKTNGQNVETGPVLLNANDNACHIRRNKKTMRNISDTEEENTCSVKDYLDESTDWKKKTNDKQPQASDQTKINHLPIKRDACEPQTLKAIKGYEKNANGEFICLDCGKVYKTRCTYNLHKRIHTGKMHSCDVCGKQFTKRANVRVHMLTHEKDGKILECYICRMQFDGFTAIRIHFARKHSAQQQFACTICAKLYSSQVNLNSHMKKHKGLTRTIKCPHCQKMFQHSGNLKTHILINHSDFMPFVCETCGHGMKTRQHLQDHMRKHTGEKPFECNECGKRLRTTEAFKNHMRTHTGERPYLCKLCPKAFSQRSNLWQHKKMHMQEKPFACSVCADRFMTRYHMNRHMKVHNDIDLFKQKIRGTPTIAEKCPQCDEQFEKRLNLQRHIKRSHKDCKPFTCNKDIRQIANSTHTIALESDHFDAYNK